MRLNAAPELAPPGAGLPKMEIIIGRMIFACKGRMSRRKVSTAKFRQERKLIRHLVNSSDAESGARRVLIKRPRGMEDSSRYWSVWMTLDHLRIVNLPCANIIATLTKGVVPPGEANVAAVKPSPAVTAAIVTEYEAACDAVLTAAVVPPDLKSAVSFAHPWFGPLDAWGWHTLAGEHMAVHRVQIERILQGLKGK